MRRYHAQNGAFWRLILRSMARFGMLLRLAVRLVWNESGHTMRRSESPTVFIILWRSEIPRKAPSNLRNQRRDERRNEATTLPTQRDYKGAILQWHSDMTHYL
jgi:hypothetical protein